MASECGGSDHDHLSNDEATDAKADMLRRQGQVRNAGFAPPTWDDERDVRIMWLWNALNLQVAKGTLTKAGRDQIMRDCFPDKANP